MQLHRNWDLSTTTATAALCFKIASNLPGGGAAILLPRAKTCKCAPGMPLQQLQRESRDP
jgi:hypothetical protein